MWTTGVQGFDPSPYDIVYPLTMSLRWVFLKTGHANMVQNQGDKTKLRNGRWFSPGHFEKTFGPINFVKRNGCLALKSCNPWSKICQKTSMKPQSSQLSSVLTENIPTFKHPSDPATTLFQRADREHPQALQKEERTRQGGLSRHSFWTFTQHRGWTQIWRVTNGEMWNPQIYILLPLCLLIRPDSWCFKNHFLLASN